MTGGSLVDVPGFSVGHWTDHSIGTGCTVILGATGFVSGVDTRGATIGTHELDLARSGDLVERIDAVLLAGGSSFGLAAVRGVMRFLEERGQGFRPRRAAGRSSASVSAGSAPPDIIVPIVVGATVFDLDVAVGRPDAQMGYRACELAHSNGVVEGQFGAGAGAHTGQGFNKAQMAPAGVGTASKPFGEFVVGALVVVNCFGSVVDPATGAVLSGPPLRGNVNVDGLSLLAEARRRMDVTTSGLVAVVGTDAPLTRQQANALATSAQGGFARAIYPFDPAFDSVFVLVLSSGQGNSGRLDAGELAVLGAVAGETVTEATVRSVRPEHNRP